MYNNMEQEQKQEDTKQEDTNPNRQIVIETDWNNITIVKNESFGSLELSAILAKILNKIQ